MGLGLLLGFLGTDFFFFGVLAFLGAEGAEGADCTGAFGVAVVFESVVLILLFA